MGLSEIVDIAGNYGVLVRIQGPDPKGLKMRAHAFHHYHSGETALSASGILWPSLANHMDGDNGRSSMPGSAIVVTVASIVEPFLSRQYRENISLASRELIPGVQIDIMAEGKMKETNLPNRLGNNAPQWLPARLLQLVDISASSVALQSIFDASSSTFEHGWEIGWSLSSRRSFGDAFKLESQRPEAETARSTNPRFMGKPTIRIAILGVSSINSMDIPNITISTCNKMGDFILAMGSPFGVLSPMHFFNSISVGTISNLYPLNSSIKTILMADIRGLPGMEGGPVFNEHADLVGMLTRPLRQRTSDAEIQLVIPWEAIAAACSEILHKDLQNAPENLYYSKENLAGAAIYMNDNTTKSVCTAPSPVEKAMGSVCLITIDNAVWASGVLLNKQGLIVTNAHLLEPWRFQKSTERKPEVLPIFSEDFKSIRVRIYRRHPCNTDPWIWSDARVIYVSRGPLDVSLLQLKSVPAPLFPIKVNLACPLPGSKVYVVGHGLFGPRLDLLPLFCSGVVSKIVMAEMSLSNEPGPQDTKLGQFPAMLQTTAPIHPGGSGGAILNADGDMIGLVTSNAKHGGGMTIPHLNFSIPCGALEPIFNFAKDMQDVSLLNELDQPNRHVSSIWALIPPLSPKPGPSLLEDNKEGGKGLRFAKFIAERSEVLKKASQLHKVDRISNDVVQSKL